MSHIRERLYSPWNATLSCLLGMALFFISPFAWALSNGVVISQVYGGGGNGGAPFNSDFIELFNRGTAPVNLTGWTVQYAPANSATWASIPLTGSLVGGQYYLIRLGNDGNVGAALPAADASLTTLNINAIAGKVALVNDAVLLNVVNPVGSAQVVDFVGYGTTANGFETARAPAPSNTASAYRAGLGCKETDNNSTDFLAFTATAPKNTSSPPYSCAAVLIGQYRMEETAWPVGAGIVKDTSGNFRHGDVVASNAPTIGTATPPRVGNPGTCRYGIFATPANSTGRINILNLPVNIATSAQTTVSFWMRWSGGRTMPIGWQQYDLWFNNNGFGFNTGGGDVFGVASLPLTNVWRHVTAIFTNRARVPNSIYIDGVLQPLISYGGIFDASFAVVSPILRVGGWGRDELWKFSGSLDELKIYNGALTQAQVTADFNETHPCGALLNVQKTVALVCDKVNGTTNPKNIPGAIVQYAIKVSNTGTAAATLTQIADTVAPTTLFDPNLVTGAGAPSTGCSATTGTPTSASGRGFVIDVAGDTRGASYPKYLTTTNADADGALLNGTDVLVNFPLALPAEAGYTAGEIRANESVTIKFNVVVQ